MADLPHVAAPGDMLAPSRTALMIVDVQHDFAAADGMAGRGGADLAAVDAAVDRIGELAAGARIAGAAVAFARVVTRPETDPPALATWLARRGTPDQLDFCRAGSTGAAFHRVAPEPGDIVVDKRLYGAFGETDLAARLRADGRDTLLLAGLTTDCCVLATAFEGFVLGFNIIAASDACAAHDAELHGAALRILALNCALLVRAETALAAWAGSGAEPRTETAP